VWGGVPCLTNVRSATGTGRAQPRACSNVDSNGGSGRAGDGWWWAVPAPSSFFQARRPSCAHGWRGRRSNRQHSMSHSDDNEDMLQMRVEKPLKLRVHMKTTIAAAKEKQRKRKQEENCCGVLFCLTSFRFA